MRKAERYRPALAEEVVAYFSVPAYVERTETVFHPNGEVRQEKPVREAGALPTFETFAARHGISTRMLRQWEEKHREFAAACDIARDLQRNALIQNALTGLYNASFARYAAGALCGMGASDEDRDDAALPRILDDLA